MPNVGDKVRARTAGGKDIIGTVILASPSSLQVMVKEGRTGQTYTVLRSATSPYIPRKRGKARRVVATDELGYFFGFPVER